MIDVRTNEELIAEINQLTAERDKWYDKFAKVDNDANVLTIERDRLSTLCDKWNTECDEMREDNKRLDVENTRLRAALEKIAGIRGRDLGEPWSDTGIAEMALEGWP